MSSDSVELEAEQQLKSAAGKWRFRRRSLIFEDHLVEEEFFRSLEDQNVWPATLVLSCTLVLLVLYFLTMSSFWLNEVADHKQFRAFIGCSNIAGIMSAGVPLVLLRRRCVSCESAMIFAAMMVSCNMFTNNTYFMANMFHIPGDFLQAFYQGEPKLILSLAVINAGLHATISVRSSRSWILPTSQTLTLGILRLCLAPWPWMDTAFMCLMYICTTYLSWIGRRKDECRARIDYIEKRVLHQVMIQERDSNKEQRQRMQEVEDRVTAMDTWAGQPSSNAALATDVGTARVSTSHEKDLTAPHPLQCRDPAFRCHVASRNIGAASAAPNKCLHLAMSGRCADASRIRKMAEHITLREYSVGEFFEDAIAAFPELELFFVSHDETSAKSGLAAPANTSKQIAQRPQGEMEYQRTIGALFSVYWMLRLDSDGKQGFCFGMTREWEVRGTTMVFPVRPCASVSISGVARRWDFLDSADWAKMREMVVSSLGGVHEFLDVERVEAMLSLTAIHDVLKMEWLCPQVADAHGPYKGYAVGAIIQDHDVALAYVMEYYPELLPSYSRLSPHMQELVLFTQSKMQFNHGWFVQAEAPPGLMLGSLRSCLSAARSGDLAFYFFHWLTDLSGAEGTPLGGAEKFVLKFPEPVLASFLWSIPYLDHLAAKTETQVMEQYLKARWQSAFPDDILPSGPSSIALLRLTVMAQGEAGIVAAAFQSLPHSAQVLLSKELARTGCEDQHFESWPLRGGPALLVYYGPALLQRCRGVIEMRMGLEILAATFAGGRALWPLSVKSHGSTVVIDVGALRPHDIKDIACSADEGQRSVWVMAPKNEREASLELLRAGELNQLNRRGVGYWVMDLPHGTIDCDTISCGDYIQSL